MKTLAGRCTGLFVLSAAMVTCASAATPPPTFKTSFDCVTVTAPIEKLICRDAQLARMDLEMNRLYRLALTDERSVPPPEKVITDQQFWTLARNQCASEADPKACAVSRYAERAYQLRQGSTIVRKSMSASTIARLRPILLWRNSPGSNQSLLTNVELTQALQQGLRSVIDR